MRNENFTSNRVQDLLIQCIKRAVKRSRYTVECFVVCQRKGDCVHYKILLKKLSKPLDKFSLCFTTNGSKRHTTNLKQRI